MPWIGQSVDAAGRPAAGHRPRRVRRRHQFSASASHAHRALRACPRPHRLDRHRGGARAARRVRGVDRGRHRRGAADRFSRGLASRRSIRIASRCWRRSACAMSAIRSPRSSPTTPTSPRTPPISSTMRDRGIAAAARRAGGAGRILAGPQQRSGDHPPGLWRRRCGVPHAPRTSSSSSLPSAGIPACRWRRAAPSAATTPRAAFSNCTAPPRCRTAIRNCCRACSAFRRAAIHVHESHVGGGFGIRGELYPEDVLVCVAAKKFNRAGEMDRGPARASDRGQSFAPAVAQDPRRGRRRRRHPRHRRSSISTTRAPMCAPTPRAWCT